MSYNKPLASGGKSTCVHCGAPKLRIVPPKNPDKTNKFPRTQRDGCPNHAAHVYATERVERGWSA